MRSFGRATKVLDWVRRAGADQSVSGDAAGGTSGGSERVKTLFITWDGPGSSYVESLFLPIFSGLIAKGHAFHILQFTWGSIADRTRTREVAMQSGVGYTSIRVLRWPITLGSLVTSILGAWRVVTLSRQLGVTLLMPRSILPALSALIAKKVMPNVKVVFDADGLPVDERIEFANMSSESMAALVLRIIEAAAVRRADTVLTRSHEASRILQARAGPIAKPNKFFRVANCRDDTQFRPLGRSDRRRIRSELGIPLSAPVIVYAGSSLTGKYSGEALLEFFRLVVLKRSDAHLMILTTTPDESEALARHLIPNLVQVSRILSVRPNEVPAYLSASDLGVAFIQPSFSMKAASAIKVGEYLLCGLPVVATAGVGDADSVVPRKICFFVEDHSLEHLGAAADWFDESVLPHREDLIDIARCAGLDHYSLSSGASRYADALKFAIHTGEQVGSS